MQIILDTTLDSVDLTSLTTAEYAIIRAALSITGVVAQNPRMRKDCQDVYQAINDASETALVH